MQHTTMSNFLLNFNFTEILYRDTIIKPEKFNADIDEIERQLSSSLKYHNSPFVYLMSDNTYKATVYYFAIIKSGRIAVMVDPDTTDFELDDLAQTVPPCCIICPDNGHIYPDFAKDSFIYHSPNAVIDFTNLDDVCTIMFTNAEDGFMKAVQITYSNIKHSIESCEYLDTFPDECALCSMLPYYHIFGLMTGPIYGTRSGGRLIIYELSKLLDISGLIETFVKGKLTNMYSVPMVYYLLGRSENTSQLKGILTSCVSGGYKLPASIAKKFFDITGVEVNEGYGITEATGITVGHKHGDENKEDSVGISTPNTPIAILNEHGLEVPKGFIGEVCLTGKCITKGFYNNKKATAKFYKEEWFHTGDFGFVDDDGYLYLTGLKKRMLNIAGKNVYPTELERFIKASGMVKNCNVYGEYSGIFGHKVIAEIDMIEQTPENEQLLKNWCKNNISGYKLPKRWEFKEIEEPTQEDTPQESTRKTTKKTQLQTQA